MITDPDSGVVSGLSDMVELPPRLQPTLRTPSVPFALVEFSPDNFEEEITHVGFNQGVV